MHARTPLGLLEKVVGYFVIYGSLLLSVPKWPHAPSTIVYTFEPLPLAAFEASAQHPARISHLPNNTDPLFLLHVVAPSDSNHGFS